MEKEEEEYIKDKEKHEEEEEKEQKRKVSDDGVRGRKVASAVSRKAEGH